MKPASREPDQMELERPTVVEAADRRQRDELTGPEPEADPATQKFEQPLGEAAFEHEEALPSDSQR